MIRLIQAIAAWWSFRILGQEKRRACGELVALYGVAYGDLYDPCAKPAGHIGAHDPS